MGGVSFFSFALEIPELILPQDFGLASLEVLTGLASWSQPGLSLNGYLFREAFPLYLSCLVAFHPVWATSRREFVRMFTVSFPLAGYELHWDRDPGYLLTQESQPANIVG